MELVCSPAKKQASLTTWVKSKSPEKETNMNAPLKKPRTFQSGGTKFVKMCDLPKPEQERIVRKWHSLVDPEAPLEDRRFEMVVAARLHAQCLEASVRQALQSLRKVFTEKDSKVTAVALAKASPEDIKAAISNVNYYPTKAKHIIQAANQIMTQFGGRVPEDEGELLKLTGIGPVFADLLAFVNTPTQYRRLEQQKESREMSTESLSKTRL